MNSKYSIFQIIITKVWKYFHKDEQNKDKVLCDVCEAKLSSKGGTTTPLINHLKTHKKEYSEYESLQAQANPKQGTKSSSSQPSISTFMPQNSELQLRVMRRLILMMMRTNILLIILLFSQTSHKLINV